MAATKRNDPKKRPVPEVERRPTSPVPSDAKRRPAKAAGKATGKATGRATGKTDRRPAESGAEGPAFIGGPRNEFGTRVARRVTCSRCGKDDHVPYAPRNVGRALCRACAAEVLNTWEVGTRAKMETKPAVCSLCKKPFALPVRVELTDEILCPDCLRGFATWTGGLDTPWENRQEAVVEQRVGGTLVRRRKQ